MDKLLLLAALAACTDPTADLTCLDEANALVPAPLEQGFVFDPVSGAPISAAYVEVHASNDVVLDDAVSTADGSYAVTLGTGDHVMRHARKLGFLDTYAHDPASHRGRALPLPMLTHADAEELASLAGTTLDPADAQVLVHVSDCAQLGVDGAMVEVAGAEAVLYLDAQGRFDPAATAMSGAGTALLINVPVGSASIDVAIDEVMYAPKTVEMRANALVTVWRRPNG